MQKKSLNDFYESSKNICKECKIKYVMDGYRANKDKAKDEQLYENMITNLQYDNKKLKKRVRKLVAKTDETNYINRELRKRVRNLEKEMLETNYITLQHKKDIDEINASIEWLVLNFVDEQEEESETTTLDASE